MTHRGLVDLESILALPGMDEIRGAWLDGWEVSQRSSDARALDILNPDVLGERCRLIAMSQNVRTALEEGLGLFKRRPLLKSLLRHCYYTFFHSSAWPDIELPQWPDLPLELDPSAGLFHVYVYLAGLPRIFEHQREKRIPLEITLDTLGDMELWIEDYFDKHGRWGFDEQGWIGGHFSGKIYKLGRLQFEMCRYDHDYHGFRRLEEDRIMVVAGDGQRFRPDGLLDGSDGYSDPQAWTAKLEITDTTITAHPIDPGGRAVREPVTLPGKGWTEILKPGDRVLAVHIPATGPMKRKACRESFSRAVPFFAEHFPNHEVHAFTCSTWLLDPQLRRVLSHESNILRFLREWYLTPEPGADDAQTIERVFGLVGSDQGTWPKDTALQRAMLRFTEEGGRWRMGAGLIFPDA